MILEVLMMLLRNYQQCRVAMAAILSLDGELQMYISTPKMRDKSELSRFEFQDISMIEVINNPGWSMMQTPTLSLKST